MAATMIAISVGMASPQFFGRLLPSVIPQFDVYQSALLGSERTNLIQRKARSLTASILKRRLKEATMSYARPVHHQQLPTVGSVAWLVIAMAFILLVVVPGALTLLAQLVSTLIL
jgi:hypothetical protein